MSLARLLVIRAGALGDVLLGAPALAALRARYPGAELHLVAPLPQGRLVGLACGASSVTGIGDPAMAPLFAAAGDLSRLPACLVAPDLAILWLRSAEPVAQNLYRLGAGAILHQAPFPPPERTIHVAEWLLQSLQALGVTADDGWDRRAWLPVPDDARTRAAAWLRQQAPDGGYLLLHPGSGSRRKNWPAAEWARTVAAIRARVDVPLLLLCGPADEEPARAFQDALAGAGQPPPAAVLRQADLPLVAGILEGALLYLGHDSGITHLAAAVGAPTVAVFGPTDPRVWRPRGPRVRVLGGTAVTPGQVAPTAWPEADAVIAAAVDLLTRR